VFVATCFSTRDSLDHWLIDNGYTNHMTFDKRRTLQSTRISKVWIGNDEYIVAKGKWTIAISINLGTKAISNVIYVADID
jgi:hypothetical protein